MRLKTLDEMTMDETTAVKWYTLAAKQGSYTSGSGLRYPWYY